MRRSGEPLLGQVDHLVYATADLDAAIADLESRLGLRATPGGRHPGRGTRNALFALGAQCYLEVIGPDPEQPVPAKPRSFGIDRLIAQRLATWAAKSPALEELVAAASKHGVRLGAVGEGSRQRPDGSLLRWRLTDPGTVIADGIVPFFIDWGDSPQPAETATHGLSLADLRAEHPEPMEVRRALSALGLPLSVQQGPRPMLIATLDGPRGRIELR